MKKLIKHELGFYKKLLDEGFSLIPIKQAKEDFKPNVVSWKPFQETAAPEEILVEWFEDQKTVSFGLVTGYNDLEVIDIDTKILPSKKEKDEFLAEFFGLLENHIEDLFQKICVVKSQSGGFHILYKCMVIEGNQKLATPKGFKEALIETRGEGGFVYIYNQVKGVKYHEIQYLEEEERQVIIEIAQSFGYSEPIQPKIKTEPTIQQDGISVWNDFSNRNKILDICSDDFDIISNGRNSTLIRRKGAKSAHSGHIFDDSGKMFLFSTGTIYPAEKPLNSFDVYTFKHFAGDYSAAAKQAYSDGYGARYVQEEIIPEPNVEEIIQDLDFPLDIFPSDVQSYILDCHKKLNSSVDFMSVSFLWLLSVLIGNTMKVKVKNGWIDSPILWIAVIGEAGVGKTPDLKQILKPLLDLNSQEIKKYIKRQKEFKQYEKLSKEDQEVNQTIEAPIKQQMVVDDITLESLVDLHSYNPKSIGVFKDELAGWLKDMNKYREGSDKERYLSAWSGDSIVLNRKTSEDAFVENPFIPILGGIQPSIFKEFQTRENDSNGFMDRMLFCDPKKAAKYPSDQELDQKVIDQYRDKIFRIKEVIDHQLTIIENSVVKPKILEFTPEAKAEFKAVHCTLVDLQNSEKENSRNKGMFAKQITYIPRFSMLIEFANAIYKDEVPKTISKASIQKAMKLSEYFISMAKTNRIENNIKEKLDRFVKKYEDKPKKELVLLISKKFPDIKPAMIAEALDISKRSVYNHLKSK